MDHQRMTTVERVAPVAVDNVRPIRRELDLSVVTPSFGYADYLRDAIVSVTLQRGLSAEHVIQDGGSTDGTVDVLKEFGQVVDWVSEPDRGQSDALNQAIARSRGRWIGWLNADEFYLPGGLAALVAEGDRSGADVVYGDALVSDGSGRLTRMRPQHPFSPFVLRSYGCFIETVACVVRRSALGPDPVDVSMRRMMDWDLYLRLLSEGARFAYVPMPVGVFRAHDTRITATERRGFLQRLNRADGFGREYDIVRTRYGALRARRAGQIVHGLEKLMTGAYTRQLHARRLRGVDLRWFTSDSAGRRYHRLAASCYGERQAVGGRAGA
jgi:glycosyltransferase involved in cell wall biosynthesis